MSQSEFLRVNRVKRRKAAAAKSLFQALIDAPEALTGGVAPTTGTALALPASAPLAVSYSAAIAAGVLVLNTAGGRVLGTPALGIDELHRVGYLDRGLEVHFETLSASPGTATLWFLDSWRRPFAIATTVFT
tara:strand:+ start:3304 stop:3699 length:396 start_codon:yes stop_codon:yes gene_type:complete